MRSHFNPKYIGVSGKSMRGSNVRVARSAASGSCDFSVKKRRGGFELVMDCGSCGARPGLENPRCFRNVLDIMQREGIPIAVTLHSHIEKRYGPQASGTLGRITDILNRSENLARQLSQTSVTDAGCRECAGPLLARLAAVTHCLRSMDIGGAASAAHGLGIQTRPAGKQRCADCTGITGVQISDIQKLTGDLQKTILRNAFGIVEG